MSPFFVEHFEQSGAAEDLEIWSIVDTLSVGVLSRIVEEFRLAGAGHSEKETKLFKRVAASFGISPQVVITNLKSVSILRNLVAHNARLWVRPTSGTPKIPKRYPNSLTQTIGTRSTYGVLLVLAELLDPKNEGESFLREVDELLIQDEVFSLGITDPLTYRDARFIIEGRRRS